MNRQVSLLVIVVVAMFVPGGPEALAAFANGALEAIMTFAGSVNLGG